MSKKKKNEVVEESTTYLNYKMPIVIKKGGKLIIKMKGDARIMSGQPAPPPKPPGT